MTTSLWRRAIWGGALLAVLLLAGSGCREPADEGDREALKIVAVTPRTGSCSYLGTLVERGMQMAIDDINAQGGLVDRPVELIKADSHSDPDAAAAEVGYYYDNDKDNVVGIAGAVLDSVSRRVLTDVARQDKKLIMISPASSSPEFARGLDYDDLFFRTVPSSLQQMNALGAKARSLGYRNGAVIVYGDGSSDELAYTFASKFTAQEADRRARTVRYTERTSAAIASAMAPLTQQAPDFLFVLA
jgi:ABC-type branched-subunit amino acid transport system substrate-binding protein